MILRRALTEPFRLRTWKETLYAVASLPLGVFWFTVLVTLLATGACLVITLVGLPILALALVLARLGAVAERWWANALIDAGVRPSTVPLLPREGPALRRFLGILLQPIAWRETLYLLLLLPAGIALFTVAVALWSAGLGALTAPAWYWLTPENDFLWEGNSYDTALEWVGVPAAGAALVLATPWAVRGLLAGHAAVVGALLGPTRGELERQRDHAVAASAGERRQLERDLHDGAQARLVALAVDLGRARERLEQGGDPEEAAALVRDAHEEAKRVLVEVRDLARGIHPAILTDRGLDAALSSLAARSPVPVALASDVRDRPPAAVESAAYFVVAEALANVARHSGAAHAAVSVARTDGVLVVEVRDDGVGGAEAAPGSGLAGLRDRVGAVGGTLTVDSPPGGPTVLVAELPCA
jgi:signal transduction histidine kinase